MFSYGLNKFGRPIISGAYFLHSTTLLPYRNADYSTASTLKGKEKSKQPSSVELVMASQPHSALSHQKVAESRKELIDVLLEDISGSSKLLGQIMVEEGLLTEPQLRDALLKQSKDKSKRLGEIVATLGWVSREDIIKSTARKLGIPFVKLRSFDIDPNAVRLVPGDIARQHNVMPLAVLEDRLVVAVEDPGNTEVIALLRFVTDKNVELAISSRDDLEFAITDQYGRQEDQAVLEELDSYGLGTSQEVEKRKAEKLGQEKPVVKLVDNIIHDAINRRASDIHLRPREKRVDLLFRIDGTMVPIRTLNRNLLAAVVSRIKIIGSMNIAERRLPQDGRSRAYHRGMPVDLRLSIIPTVHGESVVVRLLDSKVGQKKVTDLDFSNKDKDRFVGMLEKSCGIFLVTGPTGSGKSTTLYAALQYMVDKPINIITVEDPVEYNIDGVIQIQTNSATHFTFARALRHILRHDPDVVMIGEIRDEETAKIAVEAALTGHLVLSTLHTNSAAATVTRLLEIGIEPYLLNSSLLGVLAQRLVRKNCPHCIEVEEIPASIRRTLKVSSNEVFYKGRGCDECNNTGYQGRMAVYELLEMSEEIRENLGEGVNANFIHSISVTQGMVPLTDNALEVARKHLTSLAEVYRVRLT